MKKPIRVLSTDFEILGEIDDYESLRFKRIYNGVGEFEITINRYKHHTKVLQKGNIILVGSDFHKVGLIKYREISFDEGGKASETLSIKGVTLNGVMLQRLIVPPANAEFDEISGSGESVMKHYVVRNVVNPDNPDRAIPSIHVAENKNRGKQINWKSRFDNLGEELSKISNWTELGWGIELDIDNKRWVFDCYEGADRTAMQSDNPPIIFSTDFESLKDGNYVESNYGFANFTYVGGKGEGIERLMSSVGSESAKGFNRFEVFTDARDTETIEGLSEAGLKALGELSGELSFDAQILTKSVFQYEKDWFLGDLVTVQQTDWGVTMNTRIVEVSEIYESTGLQLEVTFGKVRPTLVSKLKQELKQIRAEIQK